MEIDLNDLFYKQENQQLEYKEALDNDNLASSIAAMATANGGYILLGVRDDGCPVGVRITTEDEMRRKIYDLAKNLTGSRPSIEIDFKEHDKDKKIVIIKVHEGSMKPYGSKGAFYKRVGSSNEKLGSDEITQIRLQAKNITFDALSANLSGRIVNISDIDESKIKDYILRINSGKRQKQTEFRDLSQTLKNLDLLNNDREIKSAGVLFFGKNPQSSFPNSKINFLIYRGDSISDIALKFRKVLQGSIVNQIIETFELIKANTENKIVMQGLRRMEINQYPLNAIREAIINAIAHRDYSTLESDIVIRLFDNRLEIINPGGLMRGVKLEELKKGGHYSVRRNPIICRLLDNLGFMEQSGQGIKNMIIAMKNFGLQEPFIEATEDFFRLEFKGQQVSRPDPTKPLIVASSVDLTPVLTKIERKGLSSIQTMPDSSITITQYMVVAKVKSRITAQNHLNKFVTFGLLKKQKVGKEWVFIKQI